MEFIDNNPNTTAKDIYQFAGKMLEDYGLTSYTMHFRIMKTILEKLIMEDL